MTAEEIEAMEAGRELDAAVAVAVFGWEWFRVERHFEPPRGREQWRALRKPGSHYGHFPLADGTEPIADTYGEHPPHYSRENGAAWQVVEAMKRRGFSFGYWDTQINSSVPGFLAAFTRSVYPPKREGGPGIWRGSAFHRGRLQGGMPLAVCRAALRAVGAAAADAGAKGAEGGDSD
jgi:hypothetical protein